LTRHPLLLPLLLIEEKLNLIEDQEMQWWNALVNVETLSRQTGAPAVNFLEIVKWEQSGDSEYTNMIGESDGTRLQSITIGVLQVLQLITYAESHARSLLLAVEEIQKSMETLNTITNAPRKVYMEKAGAVLSEKLDLLAHRIRVVISNIQFVEKRAQAQQSAVSLIKNSMILNTVTKQSKVYNYIARLDSQTQQKLAEAQTELAKAQTELAKAQTELAQSQKEISLSSNLIAQASKRDSSAMKGIALLTMVFLPGTYIAVCNAYSSIWDCKS
jgi:hypothetical protein